MAKRVLITENFLLESEAARELYFRHARELPIIDFHCHLPPAEVAGDRRFANMAEIWLAGDHYKWRAMRSNGVAERYCTGDATDWEKFEKWAETVPCLVRNPLYHWTHLELDRPFGIADRLFGPDTARGIWGECNEKLAQPEFSARGIMKQMKVALVCTTDDPVDGLEAHRIVNEDAAFGVKMLPTWRPDKAMALEDPAAFNAYAARLEAASGMACPTWADFLDALRKRQLFFHERGCRLSDHGLETPYAEDCTESEAAAVYARARSGQAPTPDEALRFRSAMMHEFGLMNHALNWAQQLHLGPIRNNSGRMFRALGPDTGFDSVGDAPMAKALSKFLDRLDRDNRLARTVLYTINPAANMVLSTMLGNFQDGSVPGKMQFGSGWWFNDQMAGMLDQIETLSQTGLLSRFVGMLTDSRSLLSYPRHDYFRRILCNVLGGDVTRGLLPNDLDWLGGIVGNISYNNANRYFGFGLPEL
jgi:glucuronate isomerase